MLQIKIGCITKATEEYIVHQCNCTVVKPHGLSATIAKTFPDACAYARRRQLTPTRNLAVLEDRPKPGTIAVFGERPVISLFGQFEMGRSGAFDRGLGVPDSPADRIKYFKAGLIEIAKLNPKSLAFPYKIGCGLGGGDWPTYRKMLEDFAQQMPDTKITLYTL